MNRIHYVPMVTDGGYCIRVYGAGYVGEGGAITGYDDRKIWKSIEGCERAAQELREKRKEQSKR